METDELLLPLLVVVVVGHWVDFPRQWREQRCKAQCVYTSTPPASNSSYAC